jgi:integrase
MAKKDFIGLEPFHRRHVERGIYAWTTPAGKKCYGISYRDPYGKRIRRITKTEKLTTARDELRRVEVSVKDGTYVDPKKVRPAPIVDDVGTVDEFREEYIDHRALDKSTWSDDNNHLRKFVEICGNKPLDEVTGFDLERFKRARREAGRAKRTVNNGLRTVCRMLKTAKAWGRIAVNPALEIETLKGIPEDPETPLNKRQRTAILDACGDDFRLLVLAALHTSCRSGELRNLDWRDVDLDDPRGPHFTPQKTKNGKVKHVLITPTLRRALEALPGPREGIVFKKANGRKWRSTQKEWAAARTAAGIGYEVTIDDGQQTRTVTRPRFHDLRHSTATVLNEAGVDETTRKSITGHMSKRMIDHYTHTSEGQKREAMNRLDAAMADEIETQKGQKVAKSATDSPTTTDGNVVQLVANTGK